ncbi:hypothetical protein NEOLEDRAFT_1140217 [Neolentinus lepideus HHB14362 ss-1]|uniref:DUF6533 domain-containing protein n=1 Tax=Neolentinus lepideus HHB14362 ss-1 TaxID=1314782 RepID=A0A165PDI0_9AGAM|nr:hypothetical protein NEOLEDRAFT_1140217 [Neolentinus lepideus HHB14362 ss-1]
MVALSSLADNVALVREIQQTRYAELASSIIVIYDHLITLDQEIELIWKSHWTIGKVLFLINRYYALASVICNNCILFSTHLSDSVSFCLRLFQWQACTGLLVSTIAEIILLLRLYALYQLNRRVLFFMLAAFIVSVGAAATILGLVLVRVSAHSQLLPGVPFCLPLDVPSWFYTFWIPLLAFESLLCGLALIRAFGYFRARPTMFQSGRYIVNILIRDSVIYYLIVFATYFANLVIFLTGSPGVLESGIGFAMAMSCVMGSRLCLNIRDVPYEIEDSTVSQVNLTGVSRSRNAVSHGTTNIVVNGSCALTEYELVELRSMRVKRNSLNA